MLERSSLGRLLLTIHHLAIDGVSWRILLPDLAAAWAAMREGRIPRWRRAGTSFRHWAQRLVAEAQDPERLAELSFWTGMLSAPAVSLVEGALDPTRDVSGRAGRLTLTLPAAITGALLTRAGGVSCRHQRCAFDRLGAGGADWCRRRGRGTGTAVLIDIEGHGREEIFADVDLSRTLGWFTSLFPMRLDAGALELAEALAGDRRWGVRSRASRSNCTRWRTMELAMGCCATSMARPPCSWRAFPRPRSASTISGVFRHPGRRTGRLLRRRWSSAAAIPPCRWPTVSKSTRSRSMAPMAQL